MRYVSVGVTRRQGWLLLSCLVRSALSIGIFLGGCAKSHLPSEVVATWPGELIGQDRINERIVDCSQVVIREIDWYSSPGVLRVYAEEDCMVSYDLQKRFCKMQAVKSMSGQDTSAVNENNNIIGVASVAADVLTLGLGVPVHAATNAKIQTLNEAELDKAVKALKAGAKEARANVYSGITDKELAKPFATATVVAEKAGEVTELIPSQSEPITRAAVRVPLRLKTMDPPLDRAVSVTDDSGWAVFTFADKPRDALALSPADIVIEGNIEDMWVELAQTKLTQDRIDLIVKKATADSMSLRGEPQRPPVAKVIPKLPHGEVRAGAECELSLTVENTGKGEFYRLIAETECAVDSLAGVAYEVGKLDPGEAVTLSRRFRIPDRQPTGPMVVAFKWRELNGHQPEPVQVELLVRGLPQPKFSVRVEAIDDNSGNSKGNADGHIQKGEKIDLLVEVRNEGDAVAQDVAAKIEGVSDEGIRVAVGSQALGEIAVNETKVARLTVLPQRTVQANSLGVTLQITDRTFGVEHREKLEFPLGSELAPDLVF